ncbi:hypothetical protein [Sphingomonas sp. CFBP 8760]|uniref:hypothetical protein n=1 Tax=Sphingomonas sp. CFBP 8760 TaxID=2775282 RepID=UPI00177E957B|nr:hypothetical protein [Sphingomonas sp. CFBP 8760]MBD8546060.1 hypothetical protein [Sphingomonas sp. CFBP 8760]
MRKPTLPVACVATAIALAGCNNKSDTSDNVVSNSTETTSINLEENVLATADGEAYADQTDMTQTAPEDPWLFKDEVDAMSDARLLKAAFKVTGQNNDAEIIVTCNPANPIIRYEVSGFDKSGEPSELTNRQSNGAALALYQIRADAGKASVGLSSSRYNNQIVISGQTGLAAASANTLTLRLEFKNSVETYVIGQYSDNFRAAVQPCLMAGKARRDRLEAERARRTAQAEPQTEHADQTAPAELSDLNPNNTSM